MAGPGESGQLRKNGDVHYRWGQRRATYALNMDQAKIPYGSDISSYPDGDINGNLLKLI